jgi:dTDP-4-dehydrorhamnose reductase
VTLNFKAGLRTILNLNRHFSNKGLASWGGTLLITGAGGLLGSNFAALTNDGYSQVLVFSPRAGSDRAIRLDLASSKTRKGLVENYRPNIVINCAAETSVESCDLQNEKAAQINLDLPHDLAKQCIQAGARFIHISSDAVFSGEEGNYSEKSTPNPANSYGRMKLEAENMVLKANPESLVFRTNFFGLSAGSNKGLADFFLTNLSLNDEVPGFTDSFISFVYVDFLTQIILEIAETNRRGIIHIGSRDKLSKHQFGRLLATTFGLNGELVTPTLSSVIHSVPRGKDLSLDVSLAQSIIGRPMPTIEEGVKRMKKDFESGRRSALKSVVGS